MKITRTASELQRLKPDSRGGGNTGFVPTMGALHEGHISLVEAAVRNSSLTIVSIFVNPNQFNDKADYERYPRNEEKDIRLLEKHMRDKDILFIPDTKEIYPSEDRRVFSFGNLDKVMEGIHRPGHFNGVAQVVSRLFDIVEADIAYFGKKDFQQLAVVKELVRQTGRKISIEGCPIVREKDGLAMSSRNQLLEPGYRAKAGIIFQTLRIAAAMFPGREIAEIKDFVSSEINAIEGFRLEYFEICNSDSLRLLGSLNEIEAGQSYVGCIALKAGRIRLIDNIELQSS